ncbi:MAG: nucleotidyltransferase [Candidatus Staskawiczbacteria bacterium]|nr:nucleotidyltransferase [Candidatus Staskawiczbacteria bacterium]
MEIENLLIKISNILDGLKIPYIITGGMAVSVWGRPRFTADIDIVVQLLSKNTNSLAKELLKLDKDVYVSEEAMLEALKNNGEFNFIDPNSQLKVDFWVVDDTFNKQKIQRAVIKKIGGKKINFISPEDLILSKLLWHKDSNSTKQLDDIKSVLAISKIDFKYLKKWAEKQLTAEILKSIIKDIDNN